MSGTGTPDPGTSGEDFLPAYATRPSFRPEALQHEVLESADPEHQISVDDDFWRDGRRQAVFRQDGSRQDNLRQNDFRQDEREPEVRMRGEESKAPLPAARVYPGEGRLASALADHFGKGFEANFVEADFMGASFADPVDEFPSEHLAASRFPFHAASSSNEPGMSPNRTVQTPSRQLDATSYAPSTGSDEAAGAYGEERLEEDALDADVDNPFRDGFTRRLARQFTGDIEPDLRVDAIDRDSQESLCEEEQSTTAPIGMRSLHWIRKNMTSLRIIVSLQRVTPADAPEPRSRKDSGN